MKMDKNRFFAVGDLHISHKNYCRGTSGWTDTSGCRDFSTIEEMNKTVLDSVNSTVGEDDILVMVGDSFFGKKSEVVPYVMNTIRCRNVFYVYGNHCHFLKKNLDQYKHFFVDVQHYYDFYFGRQQVVVNHFPYLVWDNVGKGAWSLIGHSHGNCKYTRPEDKTFKQLDVGWDIFRKPVSYYEIEEIMNTKGILDLDHHSFDS